MHQIKRARACLFLCVLALILGGCSKEVPEGSPPPPGTTCKRGALIFDRRSFALGTTYTTPVQIYSEPRGLAANISSLLQAAGGQLFNLGRIVNTTQFPFGHDNFLNLNNTALVLNMREDTRLAVFEYLDQGGFINLGARSGANQYIGSMYTMPATLMINGVRVSKHKVQEFFGPNNVKVGEKGIIRLEYSADIGTLIIGGQELHVDNFCFN